MWMKVTLNYTPIKTFSSQRPLHCLTKAPQLSINKQNKEQDAGSWLCSLNKSPPTSPKNQKGDIVVPLWSVTGGLSGLFDVSEREWRQECWTVTCSDISHPRPSGLRKDGPDSDWWLLFIYRSRKEEPGGSGHTAGPGFDGQKYLGLLTRGFSVDW